MNAVASPPPEFERLRLLAIMGVDVYVPRDTPLARASQEGSAQTTATTDTSEVRAPAASGVARLIVWGVGRDEHPKLLAAVLRGARLRAGEWTLGTGTGGGLPVWRFGSGNAGETAPAMTFPQLAELRNSVTARRSAWHQIRAWLRAP